jgi:hypothetical protein
MKKIIIALAASSALATGVPAAAQYGGANVQIRVDQLQTQLQAGLQSGAITRAEAIPLREQLRQLSRLERQYSPGGISGRERADLQRRSMTLRQDIRSAARIGNGRYGRDDGYDRDGRYGGNDVDDRYDRDNDGWDDRDSNRDGRRDVDARYDVNRDGWDDRDSNRDGRVDVDARYDVNRDGWDDRDSNRDGRWDVDARNDVNRDGWDDRDEDRDGRWDDEDSYGREQAATGNGGVIGQIIDRVTGNGGLRVGQQASANLGAVPSQYRAQYRDGNGAYFRSDGRQIYEIDARTHVVARVYPMNR